MRTTPRHILAAVAKSALALAVMGTSLHAQSSDAIIDKLVEKGILTAKEANELREEADKGFTSAYQSKSGLPDWVTSMRLYGDFRGRFEGFHAENEAFTDRARWRYRLRFGATATIKDDFEVGLRLTSGERVENFGGDPISPNATLGDNGSKKFLWIDLAYGKWSPINTPQWTGAFTFGKIENPFVFSDMIFDQDYTPEGAAQQFGYALNEKHSFKFNLGEFILDEVGSSGNDAYLFGAQLRFESVWNTKIQTSLGFAALAISGDEALLNAPTGTPYSGVPNLNRGNTRTPVVTAGGATTGGALVYNYNPILFDAAFTYTRESFPRYAAPFPIRFGAEYMINPAAKHNNQAWSAGVTFGKSGRKGLWDFSYRYKVLEADAWYEELVDSDFGAFYESAPAGGASGYGAGTNVRGHVFRASYSPFDSMSLGLTYFMTELVDEVPNGSNSDMGRVQLDAMWRF